MNPAYSRYIPIVAIALSAFLVMQTVNLIKENRYIGGGVPSSNVISVSGSGEAFAVPDIATFSFGVEATGKNVNEAQKQVNKIVDEALSKVKAQGVSDKDIKTTDYNAYPKYQYLNAVCPTIASANGAPTYCPPGKQVLEGYTVSETITVKVRKVDDAGTILGEIGGAGVTNVSGLTFTVDDPSAVETEARAEAIAEAKTKAEELAKALGVKIVRIVSFNENGGGYPTPTFMKVESAGAAASDSVANISVGQNKVTSNVTITYEIR